MKKVDHIGIAVTELQEAIATYENMGFVLEKIEEVPEQKVRTAFFKVGETHIELLEAMDETSPIAKFLAKRGPGIHHIAMEVENLDDAMAKNKEAGIRMTQDKPSLGAGGHRINFVHPKSTGGVLMELCDHHPLSSE